MASVILNGVRVYDAELEIDWETGAFAVCGEIGQDEETVTSFWSGEQCVVDRRTCRAIGRLVGRGRVTIRGEAFPWRRDEWATSTRLTARMARR